MSDNATVNQPELAQAKPCPCRWTMLLAYLAIGVVTTLAGLAIQHKVGMSPDYGDPDGWGKRGFWMAEGKGLVDANGSPSAMRGPVPPMIYAASAWLFGINYKVLLVTQACFFGLSASLIAAIGQFVFDRWRVSLLAVFMMIGFVPAWPWLCNIFSEPIFTAVLAAFMLSWLKASEKPASMWRWVLVGLLLGITALTRPVLYFFVPFVLLDACWRLRLRWRTGFVFLWLMLGFFVVEGPWLVRNYQAFGKIIPTTSGSSQALHLCTWYQQANWIGNPYQDPKRFPPAGEGFWDLPKPEQDRRFKEMAWENLRTAPVQVLLLIPKRTMMFFFQMKETGWMPTVKSILLNSMLYPTALLGFWLAGPTIRRRLMPCVILVLFNAAFYSALQSEYRYSHPIQPYLMLLSSFGLWAIADRLFSLFRQSSQPTT